MDESRLPGVILKQLFNNNKYKNNFYLLGGMSFAYGITQSKAMPHVFVMVIRIYIVFICINKVSSCVYMVIYGVFVLLKFSCIMFSVYLHTNYIVIF